MTTFAALGACAILAGLSAFQVALAAGAPLGRYAWGGQHEGVLPTRLRIASLASVVVYALIALVLLWRADLVPPGAPSSVVRVSAWVVTGYFLLGTVMNGISRSRPERNVMTPTAAALFVLSLVVSVGP
jgi:hypothetical protein